MLNARGKTMKTISLTAMTKTLNTPSQWEKMNIFSLVIILLLLLNVQSFAQGVGISESSITPDPTAILELRSTTRGLLLPRLTTTNRDLITTVGMTLYNSTTSSIDFYSGSWISLAPLASPTFTGTVGIPTPFNLGGVSVTSTAAKLNFLTLAAGTTGTTSTNLVFSTSPTLTTPNIGAATGTSLGLSATTNQLVLGTTTTTTLSALTPTLSRVVTFPDPGAAANVVYDVLAQTISGAKTFSALGTFNLGITSTGAAVSLNASSNFGTNINTGTSTGAIAIGNSLSTGITQQVGTGNYSLDGTAGSTYTIGSSTTTGTITVGGTAQTNSGSINIGNSSSTVPINIGTGTGVQTLNLGTGGTGSKTINIGTGAIGNTITLGNATSATTVNINTGTATDAVTTLGTTGSQVFASSTTNSDKIAIQPQSTTATAAFEGTVTSDDLTAIRTWTMPDATGSVPVMLDKNIGNITVSNNLAETAVYTYTAMPAGILSTNHGIRINLYGTYTNNSGAARTITVRVRYGGIGGAIIHATGAMSLAVSATARSVRFEIIIYNFNSASAQRATGTHEFSAAAAPPAATNTLTVTSNTTGAANTASAGDLVVSIQHSAANAALTFSKDVAITEFLP